MNLYLLTQDSNAGYDTYDSCVVASTSSQKAQKIHPYYSPEELQKSLDEGYSYLYNDWARPGEITVTYIGYAAATLLEGEVICASFNAG